METTETTAHLIATCSRLPRPEDLALLPAGARWIELRADSIPDLDETAAAGLRERLDGGLVFTLRSRREGGEGPDDPLPRAEALAAAGARGDLWDLVDLEAERDLVPQVLDAVPPERRILSWHGQANGVDELEERFDAMAETPARLYKLVAAAHRPGEELAPLRLLQELRQRGRRDAVAFATGPSGLWTRIVAPRVGAPVVYGSFPGDRPAAPGQPSVDRLVVDYGLPEMPPAEWICGVVGRPVDHSLSPRLHNRAYRELGVPGLYLAFHAEHFGDFWLEVVESGVMDVLGLPLHGLSVTTPYKEAALAVAGAPSPRAIVVGAANTLVERGGVWEAESTDPEGVVLPVRELGVEIDGAPAAVVGAGGAGRSAVVGLRDAGAEVTLVNRSEERGREAARDLGVPFEPLAGFDPSPYEIVVHATSLGREADDPLPFEPLRLAEDAVVVDLVYTDTETPLLAAVREAGRRAVDGREVLLFQALEQFRMMTGLDLPVDLAHRALGIAPAPEAPSAAGAPADEDPR